MKIKDLCVIFVVLVFGFLLPITGSAEWDIEGVAPERAFVGGGSQITGD